MKYKLIMFRNDGRYYKSQRRNSDGCGWWDDVTHSLFDERPDERSSNKKEP